MAKTSLVVALSLFSLALISQLPARAQALAQPHSLVTQGINEGVLVTLRNSTRPEANAANDRGRVADSMALDHLWLQLKPSAEQQTALETYLGELEDANSPNYHKWLTAAEFGANFGASDADIQTITLWLESHGFTVNGVATSRLVIYFSGTAGDVRNAFHSEIHHLNVDGQSHIANVSDQQIPASLASVVMGVVSLSDIFPKPLLKAAATARPVSEFSSGSGRYMGAADMETIYNLNPLFAAGYSGQGQTIVVVEDSDMYDTNEWTQFRRLFGLTRPYVFGSLTEIHPTATTNPCIDPGVNGDDVEATVDAQWASAAAPNAAIQLAACRNTTNFGGFIALQNLLNGSATPPAIVSISYGESEGQAGAAENAFINSLYQQAVAEGVSVFVSSGDSGADANMVDRRNNLATVGITVNAFGSTQYNVSVGGTDFGDTAHGQTSTYWNTTNSVTLESAKSYIREIPWNSSCASQLIALFYGFTTTYGPSGFCNSTTAANDSYQSVTAASGGPSAIYSKPSWQMVFGNPADGVRDLPDVALFAAVSVSGTWNHALMFCYSQPIGTPPTAFPCAQGFFFTVGGTSLSSPIMAGIQSLVNQKTGQRWGNPAPVYYTLANSEYGAAGNSVCNSSLGNTASPSCIFYDITEGDIDIICRPGSTNCYSDAGGTFGVLSTSTTSYEPAYPATIGWDFATGIGSVNAFNLVMGFPTVLPAVTAAVTGRSTGQ